MSEFTSRWVPRAGQEKGDYRFAKIKEKLKAAHTLRPFLLPRPADEQAFFLRI